MKEETKKVYHCDFCKKILFLKHAMAKHETMCNNNPKNWDACINCANCQEVEVKYYVDGYYSSGEGQERTVQGFKCTKLDKDLYPFKAFKKNLPEKWPETFEGKEQMPNKCDHHEFPW